MLVEYCHIAVHGVHATVLHHLHQVSVRHGCTLFVFLSLQVITHMTSSQLMPSSLSPGMYPRHIYMTALPVLLQPEKFFVLAFPTTLTHRVYLLKRPLNTQGITTMSDSSLMLSTQSQDI